MAVSGIPDMGAAEIARAVRGRDLSCAEVAAAFAAQADRIDTSVHAYVTACPERMMERARELDADLAAGRALGALCGVPVAVKDNILVSGLPATCSSRMLKDYIAPYNAHVTERLDHAGALITGKTNLDEFAMGSSTENSAFFPTRNPWDLERVPGGSSGGSAAAVAARMAPLSLGSDTGGSIRQPASFCGVVGLKPTYGRVSRYGLVAFASSLDQIGPFARSVGDAALLLTAIAGHDERDSTSASEPSRDFSASLTGDIRGLRIGLPQEYFVDGLEPEVRAALDKAAATLRGLGAEIREISLPHTTYAVAAYYIIAPCEASANLARFDGVRYGHRAAADSLLDQYEKTRGEGFGPEVKRRIMLGTYALSAGYYDAYYGRAQRVRTLIRRDFDEAFRQVDVILTPTTPTAAFRAGEKTADPLTMYLSDIFTISCNLAGLPGLSLPCGRTTAGLPIGMQLMGPLFREDTILNTGYAYETATDWHHAAPSAI